jgi:tRNA nucleotidyltransferase (CCA-adding enzyme)
MKELLERIRPTREERQNVTRIIEECMHILQERIAAEGIHADVSLQGSMAKDTWISGDNNIDIFLVFPHEYSEEQLKEYGLHVGVLSEYEIAYAEHPYVRNFMKGYEIDVVPAYQFKEGVRSSVDRTPLHTEYVKTHLKDKDQVRLLKKFTRSIGVYGSDLKVQGFSGYLCELLVIKYDMFINVLKAASSWRRGEVVVLEGPPKKKFTEPFVVLDPVDAERNVAAVVSLENFATFVYYAREYLKNEDPSYFFRTPEPYRRLPGTRLYRIDFAVNIIDDILFPQLRKTRDYLVAMLETHGFRVVNTAVYDSGVLLELSVVELPPRRIHMGPPVYAEEHCTKFLEKHNHVYIKGDRLYAVVNRKYGTAEDLLHALLEKRQGFGRDLAKAQSCLTQVSGDVDYSVYS